MTEERRDVVADVAAVERQGVLCCVKLVEVAIEQLVKRGRRPRVAPLGDLDHQSVADHLGLPHHPRPIRHDLDEVCRLLVIGSTPA
jgi:hypothetical protein